MKRRLVVLSITVIMTVLLAVPAVFATNGMSMIGFGARMSAMGGVSQGMSGDACQIFGNPAAIGFVDGSSMNVGIGLLMPAVHFSNSMNDIDADSKTFPLPSLGYVNGMSDSPWAFGVGFHAQGGMGATFPEMNHNIFRNYQDGQQTHALIPQEYHSEIAYMKFVPTVAYKFSEKLSAGFGLQVGYATLQMAMPYSMDPMLMAGATGMGMTFGQMFAATPAQGGLGYSEVTAYADMKDGTSAMGYGAILGLQYKANDMFTFGFSYTLKSTLNFEGDAKLDMTSQFGDAFEKMVMGYMAANPTATPEEAMGAIQTQLGAMGIDQMLGMEDAYDAEIEFAWPQTIGFGVGINPNEKLTIGIDVKWINWSETMEKFAMDFTGGTNSNINTMMGTPDGNISLEMPLEWDDQISIGVGAEYMVSDALALRAGFNYASNPVPENTLIPIFPAVVETHITFGAGYLLTENIGIDFGYELVPANDMDVATSLIANEYNGSNSELGESVIHFSLNYKF
jgi:long-chain fatty acid transport protein